MDIHNIHIYIYIYIYMCMHIYIYICIHNTHNIHNMHNILSINNKAMKLLLRDDIFIYKILSYMMYS